MNPPDHNRRWELEHKRQWEAAVHAARVRPLTGKTVLDSATCLHIDAELTRLRAENEALRPDAERYRAWRREFVGASIGSISALLAYASTSDDVDAAIDAAKGGAA